MKRWCVLVWFKFGELVNSHGLMNEYVPVFLIKRGKFIKRRQGFFLYKMP